MNKTNDWKNATRLPEAIPGVVFKALRKFYGEQAAMAAVRQTLMEAYRQNLAGGVLEKGTYATMHLEKNADGKIPVVEIKAADDSDDSDVVFTVSTME